MMLFLWKVALIEVFIMKCIRTRKRSYTFFFAQFIFWPARAGGVKFGVDVPSENIEKSCTLLWARGEYS